MTEPERAHVRAQQWLMIELVVLMAAGGLAGVVLVVAGVLALRRWQGPVVAAAVAGGVLVIVAAGGLALLVRLHTRGVGRFARHDTGGRGGRLVTVLARDGTALHAEVDGPVDAEVTVVFCHGWIVDLTTWRHQRAALAESNVRRVFYDQRGHGESGWQGLADGETGVRQLADDLAAVIAATAPTGRLVLAGHSLGGMTVLAFAHRHADVVAERVDGLLLCAATAGPLSESLGLGLPRWFRPGHWAVRRYAVAKVTLLGLLPRRLVRLVGVGPWVLAGRLLATAPDATTEAKGATVSAMWRSPLDVAAACLRAVLDHDERDVVRTLDGEAVVVVSGDRDRLVPYADQVALARLVEGARQVTIEGCGHMVSLEAPDTVSTELGVLVARAQVRAAAGAKARKPQSPARLRLIRLLPPSSLAAWRSRPPS